MILGHRIAVIAGITLGVSACAVDLPPRPDIATPQAYHGETADAAADPSLPAPPVAWWKSFQSAEIDRIVDLALANNHDLQAAIARIAQAEANFGFAEGDEALVLDAVGSAEVNGPGGGVGTATSRSDWDTQRNFQGGLRASYEVDLWGKKGYATSAAYASALSSVFDREVVALTLVSEVVTRYFDYLSLAKRLAIAEANVANSERALVAVTRRADRGDATRIEVMQSRTSLASARSQIPALHAQRDKALNALAALLGTVSADLTLAPVPFDTLIMPNLHAGLPSNLVCQRPDIRKAEAEMAAARFDVGVARAKMLPTFSITGEAGFGSQYLSKLFDPVSLFYSLAGNLLQNVFDGGKARAEERYSEAKYRELIENYHQTILNSVRDVEDSLSDVRFIAEQEAALAQAAENAQEAHSLSLRAYERGAVDYITLLDTERTLFDNEDALQTVRAARLKAAVSLYAALGGGTDAPHCQVFTTAPAEQPL